MFSNKLSSSEMDNLSEWYKWKQQQEHRLTDRYPGQPHSSLTVVFNVLLNFLHFLQSLFSFWWKNKWAEGMK